MKKFKIRGALGGSFGGCKNKDWIEIEADDLESAMENAQQLAVEEYESYEGLHGIRSIREITEDGGVDENEAEEIYIDERDSWLDYEAEEIIEAAQ